MNNEHEHELENGQQREQEHGHGHGHDMDVDMDMTMISYYLFEDLGQYSWAHPTLQSIQLEPKSYRTLLAKQALACDQEWSKRAVARGRAQKPPKLTNHHLDCSVR